jgi:hypothetical protein
VSFEFFLSFIYYSYTSLIILNIYLMLSPTSSFATRDFVAKVDVGPRVRGPVCNEAKHVVWPTVDILLLRYNKYLCIKGLQECMWV